MSDIVFIAPVEEYAQREVPPFTKINAQHVSKINTLKDNLNLINTDLETVFQGAVGGVEQAKIPFAMASAPTGWTRDTGFSTDRVLRLTDGVSVPPGANPNNTGGQEGGDWQMIGSSAAVSPQHQHSLQSHTHVLGSHTHTITAHAHNDNHTHEQFAHSHGDNGIAPTLGNSTVNINALPAADVTVSPTTHNHTVSTHFHSSQDAGAGTTGGASTGVTDTSGSGTSDPSGSTSGSASGNLTANEGDHIHTVNHGSSWRPKYLNIIMCKRD